MEKELLDYCERIRSKEVKVGIIGLGYVGLPLVLSFCRAGFRVTGFDIDANKIRLLKKGESYISHIASAHIQQCASAFSPTSDFAGLAEMDCIIICVPTPLNKYREPDLSYVLNTTTTIARYIRKGQLISLESTTYPGTTDEDMRAILEESGLRAGTDFYLAYSPEREDPNNKSFSTGTIPKVVGGYTPECLSIATALYSQIIERVIPVSSTKAAEATKLLENIYRAVNIALVNELKVLFDRMGIDVWEVIEAAKTKPFGFQAFYPGPGLGGHCIPIDPFYLTWKAREYDFSTRFIELAGEINTDMPYYVVEKTIEALNANNKGIHDARILILGLAYKKDVDDTRESPSLKLMEIFQKKGAEVDYNDPYIPLPPKLRKYKLEKGSVPLTRENLGRYDCVIVATDHSAYDPDFILENAQLVVDTRNLIKNFKNHSHKVIKA
ncbi:MAG: nucleotide sugar dehydrogenase [Thermodesulfovibrionales bacterium]|jgi:UDP-N-acetyl-D-glucosamine dehydrogenase